MCSTETPNMSQTYRRNVFLAASLLVGGCILLVCGVDMYLKDEVDTAGQSLPRSPQGTF